MNVDDVPLIKEIKPNVQLAQSAWAVDYTDCISAQGGELHNELLDTTINNLMVRFP